MTDVGPIMRELVAKLDQLSQENVSVAGLEALKRCRQLCLELNRSELRRAEPGAELYAAETAKRVLIVDDDEDSTRVLKFVLQREGFHVGVLGDPLELKEMLNIFRPHVIVLSMVMSMATCADLLPQIKSDPRYARTKIIVSSARAFDRDRLEALRLGASDFVAKPFHTEELVLRVRNLAD